MTSMKKWSKRGLAFLVALVMCLGMLNLTAFAEGEDLDELDDQPIVEVPIDEEPQGGGNETDVLQDTDTKNGADVRNADEQPAGVEDEENDTEEILNNETDNQDKDSIEITGPVVTVTVDGSSSEVSYADGVAQVVVDGGDKTIICVTVDDEIVLNQSATYGEYGDGKDLAKTWSQTFEDGEAHTVEVTLGYKLTVMTRYVNSEEINGGWLPAGAPDASEPTFYTVVVPAGVLDEPIHLIPMPSEDGKYPLRLLDYVGISHPGMGWQHITAKYDQTYLPGSDDPSVWIEQGQDKGSNVRHCVLEEMIEKDTTVELRYNYSKIATFVRVVFEDVHGNYIPEEYNGGSPAHLANYHSQDTLVNGVDRVTFDPYTKIFGDEVNYPNGTTAGDYTLRGAVAGTDHTLANPDAFSGGYPWINFYGWDDNTNAAGAEFFKSETGLLFDPSTGAVDGTLINAIDARNIIMMYYFQLKRPVVYDANGGEGSMDAYDAVNGEAVTVAANGFSRSGYVFTGWNTAADGSGTAYNAGETLTMGAVESITLYAQWTDAPKTHTVTYVLNGGTSSAQLVYTDLADGIETPTIANPTREGYTFNGWSPEVAETVTGDATYTAQWTVVSNPTPPSDDDDDDDYTPPSRDDNDSTPTTPVVDIEDEEPPLAEQPVVDIEDEEPPLAEQPEATEELAEIVEEDPPLADVPETGDNSVLWLLTAGLAGAGVAGVTLKGKKREDAAL